MSEELLYTSAPRGLKAGARGFCTVEATAGMPPTMAQLLESLSGYRHLHAPGDSSNPVVLRHVIATVAGVPTHILSRIADAGLDYSGRSNKIAHHLAATRGDLNEVGPAWTQLQDGFHQTAWSGEAKTLSAARPLPAADVAPAPCQTWAAVAGDAGWAGVLAGAVATGSLAPLPIVVRPDQDVLALIAEAVALLPPRLRWQATYTTFHTQLPPGAQCAWRFVLDGTKEAEEVLKRRDRNHLDLRKPLGPPPAGPWVEAARTGERPVQQQAVPVVQATTTPAAVASPFIEEPAELAAEVPALESTRPAPPPPPPGRRVPYGKRGDFGRLNGRSSKRSIGPIVVTLIAVLATGVLGGLVVWTMDPFGRVANYSDDIKSMSNLTDEKYLPAALEEDNAANKDEGAAALKLNQKPENKSGTQDLSPINVPVAPDESTNEVSERPRDPSEAAEPTELMDLFEPGTRYEGKRGQEETVFFNYETMPQTLSGTDSVDLAIQQPHSASLVISSVRSVNSIKLLGEEKNFSTGDLQPLAMLAIEKNGVRVTSLHPRLPLSKLAAVIEKPSSASIHSKLVSQQLRSIQPPLQLGSDSSLEELSQYFSSTYSEPIDPEAEISIALTSGKAASGAVTRLLPGDFKAVELARHQLGEWFATLQVIRTEKTVSFFWRIKEEARGASLPLKDVSETISDWGSWSDRIKAFNSEGLEDGFVEAILEMYYGPEPNRMKQPNEWKKWSEDRASSKPAALQASKDLNSWATLTWPEAAYLLSTSDGQKKSKYAFEVLAYATDKKLKLGFVYERRLRAGGDLNQSWWKENLAYYETMIKAADYAANIRCGYDFLMEYVLQDSGDRVAVVVATTRDIPEVTPDE